ncbi:hypothetical protein ACFYXS_02800 [Streptomyces sp. NPDC002574]|uniref:hypothetical protein n=1 Tax=Streptomyces sp. NPDC002574 TaxID=3364652 RepID=UPI0036C01F66
MATPTITMQVLQTDGTASEPQRTELVKWAQENWDAHRQGDESTARVKAALRSVQMQHPGTEAFKDFTVDNALNYLHTVCRLRDGSMGVFFSDAGVMAAFKLTELVPLPENLERDFIS